MACIEWMACIAIDMVFLKPAGVLTDLLYAQYPGQPSASSPAPNLTSSGRPTSGPLRTQPPRGISEGGCHALPGCTRFLRGSACCMFSVPFDRPDIAAYRRNRGPDSLRSPHHRDPPGAQRHESPRDCPRQIGTARSPRLG